MLHLQLHREWIGSYVELSILNWPDERRVVHIFLGYKSELELLQAREMGQSLAQFYFPIVVILSGLFESNVSIFIVATWVSVPCIIVAHLLGANWLNGSEVLTPNILIDLTAFTTWLSSRQLLTVLHIDLPPEPPCELVHVFSIRLHDAAR